MYVAAILLLTLSHLLVLEYSILSLLHSLMHKLTISAARTQFFTGRRVNEQAKRLDHITRALRIEAPEAIAKKYAEQVAEDRAAYKVTYLPSISTT